MTLAFFSTPPPVVKGGSPVLTSGQPDVQSGSAKDFLSAMEQASRDGTTQTLSQATAPPATMAGSAVAGNTETSLAAMVAAALFKPMKDAGKKHQPVPVLQEGKTGPTTTSTATAKPLLNRGSNAPITGSNTVAAMASAVAAKMRKPVLAETSIGEAEAAQEQAAKPASKTAKRTATTTAEPAKTAVSTPILPLPVIPVEISPILASKGTSHSVTDNLKNDAPKPAEVDPSMASAPAAATAPARIIIFDEAKGLTVTSAQNAWMDRVNSANSARLAAENKAAAETAAKMADVRASVTPASDKPAPVPPSEAAATLQPPIAAAPEITPSVAFMAQGPADGTAGALTSQRMKSKADKNEIAGPTAQKMPTTTAKAVLSSKPADGLAAASLSGRGGARTDALTTPVVTQWSSKPSEWNVELNKAPIAAAPAADPSAQAERIGQMINQQVAMVRQAGTNNLTVSLKLDPQTELNLQLTSHNGQIEASVQWERGSVAGLENHWKDLQDSLARQNVQLLPLDTRMVVKSPSFNPSSDQGSSSLSHQMSQNSQRQNRGPQPDLPGPVLVKNVPVTNKTTARTAPRQGWESWA